MTDRWILPDGVTELLPPEAAAVEALRRQVLDLYACWGYELVEPPLVEYLESLLTGMGRELDVQTFKLVDQHNGRSMGLRADITPQVARIDAHRLNRGVPTRLCYFAPVLHARGDEFGRNRNPLQVGAELYGHGGLESDVESIELMLETLRLAGVSRIHLDLGHVGIFRGLAAGLQAAAANDLFQMLQRKSSPEIEEFLARQSLPNAARRLLGELVEMNGDANMLAAASERLSGCDASVTTALQQLREIGSHIEARHPDVTVHYDLAEFRAYDYQTGLVFAAYREGYGLEIARGGRYDEMGEVFGVARPATGFSADVMQLAERLDVAASERIMAPAAGDGLEDAIASLRRAGSIVVRELPGQRGDAAAMGCTARLVVSNRRWRVEPV